MLLLDWDLFETINQLNSQRFENQKANSCTGLFAATWSNFGKLILHVSFDIPQEGVSNHILSLHLFVQSQQWNTRTICEIFSKIIVKIPERNLRRHSGVSLLNLNIFHTLLWCLNYWIWTSNTAEKMKFSINNFLSKCDQIRSFLGICSYLLKKSLMENFIFCEV